MVGTPGLSWHGRPARLGLPRRCDPFHCSKSREYGLPSTIGSRIRRSSGTGWSLWLLSSFGFSSFPIL